MTDKLYILTYDHGGYVLWGDSVKPRLKELLEWMKKYPKLKIGLDYESFTFDEFSKSDPEIIELCRELFKKYPGRVGLGATTYAQPLSMFISEESNVRQLSYAVTANLKYFNITPSVYAISEFALNNQIPQLATLCGYKAAILRSHVMGYGYPVTFDSPWGKWIGKDGTSIDAVPTYDGQGRGFNCTTLDNWILSRWPYDTHITLEDFQKKFSKYSPLLASRYDDLTQKVDKITDYIETQDNFQYILLEDIPSLYGEATDELRTTDNDFHTQMPWGYCGNEIFNGGRKTEIEALKAEKLNAISFMLGGEPLYENIEEAWKNALITQHHDVMICGLLELARRFIPASLEQSDIVKTKSLDSIATYFKGDGKGVMAVNLHSFSIDEWVNFNGETYHVSLPAFTGKILEKSNEKFVFNFDDESKILTTPYYKIKLNDRGIEYINSALGEALVDNKETPLFTALVDDVDCCSQGKWSVKLNDFSAALKYTGKIGSVSFEFNMRFFGNSKRIDCDTCFEVDNQRIGSNKETSGRSDSFTVNGHLHTKKLCLNLNLKLDNDRKMYRDLPFSISQWSGDIRKNEDYWYEKENIVYDEKVSAQDSFNSTTHLDGVYWIALRDENKGFAVLNKGCMGSAVSGNYVQIPLLYSNDYMCGTRILNGNYTNEFSLLPFENESNANIHKMALSYNYQPDLYEGMMCDKGKLLKFADFNFLTGEVILTSIYPENGKLYARFCNYSDENAIVEFSSDFAKIAYETDLLGNKIKEIESDELSFRAWEIKTICLQK